VGIVALTPTTVVDTRGYFRPLAAEFVTLLRSVPPAAWERPTMAQAWGVRDVVAHLADTALRRLSSQRDEHRPPPDDAATPADLVSLVNTLNATWVTAMRRLSPAVLTDVYALAVTDLAQYLEGLPLDTPPLFPVSWAGEDGNQGWLDIGREFTEQWHHQAQVRDALDARPPSDPAWLSAVLQVAMHGLPRAFRDATASTGTTVGLEVDGRAGGCWTIVRGDNRWTLWQGWPEEAPSARIAMSDDTAWRLLFNGLRSPERSDLIRAVGDQRLIAHFWKARSVIV
jgi:hypothetical protein